MKIKDKKSLEINCAKNKLYSLKKDLFTFLKQKEIGQFNDNFRIKEIKKDITLIKIYYLKVLNKWIKIKKLFNWDCCVNEDG